MLGELLKVKLVDEVLSQVSFKVTFPSDAGRTSHRGSGMTADEQGDLAADGRGGRGARGLHFRPSARNTPGMQS